MAVVDTIPTIIDDVIDLRQVRAKVAPQCRPLGWGQHLLLVFVLAEPGAGKLDESRDRRRLPVLAAAVAELVISQPRRADLEPARELGAVPAHAGAKGDQLLRRHAEECKTSNAACKQLSRISP